MRRRNFAPESYAFNVKDVSPLWEFEWITAFHFQDDARLSELVKQYGNHWSYISSQMRGLTPKQVCAETLGFSLCMVNDVHS